MNERIKLTESEIVALDEWNTIAECKLHFIEDDNSDAYRYWKNQLYTSDKYLLSTLDGKASPTVLAYVQSVKMLIATAKRLRGGHLLTS